MFRSNNSNNNNQLSVSTTDLYKTFHVLLYGTVCSLKTTHCCRNMSPQQIIQTFIFVSVIYFILLFLSNTKGWLNLKIVSFYLISLKSILILSFPILVGLQSGLHLSAVYSKLVQAFKFSSVSATCPANLTQLSSDHTTDIRSVVQFTYLVTTRSSSVALHFLSLQPKYLPQLPVLHLPWPLRFA